jgi:hypothetical protein
LRAVGYSGQWAMRACPSGHKRMSQRSSPVGFTPSPSDSPRHPARQAFLFVLAGGVEENFSSLTYFQIVVDISAEAGQGAPKFSNDMETNMGKDDLKIGDRLDDGSLACGTNLCKKRTPSRTRTTLQKRRAFARGAGRPREILTVICAEGLCAVGRALIRSVCS